MVLLTHTLLPFVAAALTATASVLPRTPASAAPAEELHAAPGTGNLIWSDNTVDDVKDRIPSLQRPDFSSSIQQLHDAVEDAEASLEEFFDELKHTIIDSVDSASKWVQEETVNVKGQAFNRLTHKDFPNYALRINTESNSTACDPGVKQYSGYFDISNTKHLWFVFFEARNNPDKAPLSLWLNGGPGCSSSTGLLFELGPCRIADEGKSVENNPHSWTNNANMIFLDQPVNVGYSYSEDGDDVNNTPAAAEDVYAMLQLFLQKYTQYAKKPFIIAGESYGGTYIPRIASAIHKKNKELKQTGGSGVHINLESVAIGNGLTEPKTQFASVPEFACSSENKYAIFKNGSSTCTSLQSKAKTCESLIESCYKYDNRLTCLPASLYCWSNLYGPLQDSGLNLYDVRRKCDREKDGSLCYKQMGWIETYMNNPSVRKAWGAEESVKFASCNMNVNQQFLFQGDGMRNTAAVLPELLADGVRVLIYNGVTDAMVNWYGSRAWVEKLDSVYGDEYRKESTADWTGADGKKAGTVRKAGKGFGNISFVSVDRAGHMVPYDVPENSLAMWEKWLANESLA